MQGTWDSPTIPVTADVDVSGLGQGIHQLYVRALDAAGNWGQASLTDLMALPDLIFADSFETGDTSRWSATVQSGGNVRVVNAAAMGLDGGTWGMRVVLSGTARGFVVDRTPSAEGSYHARFYFHPNGTVTGNVAAGRPIFVGANPSGNGVFWVEYRRRRADLPMNVRGVALSGGTVLATGWYGISNAPHSIEIAWSSGPSATFDLYVDGALRRQLTGLNTSAYRIETVRLGPPAGSAYPAPGVEFFDAFVSRRFTVIGP